MALPTRSLRARLLWAVVAVVLLLTTSVTMMLGGTNFAALFLEAASVFWGFVAGLADLTQVVFAAVGPALLVALAVGAIVDLVMVAVYLSVSRRRAREVSATPYPPRDQPWPLLSISVVILCLVVLLPLPRQAAEQRLVGDDRLRGSRRQKVSTVAGNVDGTRAGGGRRAFRVR